MQFNIKHGFLFFLFGVFLISCKTTSTIPYWNTSTSYAKDFTQHLEPNAKLIRSWYHYTVEMTQDRKYILKMYYPEKKAMTSRHEFSDKNLNILEGKSSYYTDEGILTSEGLFSQNKKTGEWKEFDWTSGKLQEKGSYVMGNKEGLWIQYDSLGTISSSYTYEENEKNGPYEIFENGKLYESGKFLYGDVVNTKMVTEGTESKLTITGFKTINNMPGFPKNSPDEMDKMPEFPGCDPEMNKEQRLKCSQTKMLKYIYSNIKYPAQARNLGVEGTAIINFVVDKDGSIQDIKAVKGICVSIASECLRLVKTMPNWIPGEHAGEAVPVSFNLPVSFKLE